MTEAPPSRLLRAWATMGLSETPDVVAEDARKQAELWEATSGKPGEEDERFAVSFGATYSDSDMAVVGREGDLLPVLTDLAHRGFRCHVDTLTEEHADELYDRLGEDGSGEYVLAYVEHDPDGDWSLPGIAPSRPDGDGG